MTARRSAIADDFAARQARSWFARMPRRETLYSAAARLHEAGGYFRPESTSQLLFNHGRGGALVDLPLGLDHLSELTGGLVRADDRTLRERTGFGPYLGLMSAPRRAAAVAACRGSGRPAGSAGSSPQGRPIVTVGELRLCTACARRQRARHGFVFWRADHQRPGCWVCLEHGTPLVYVPARPKYHTEWLVADRCVSDGRLIELPRLAHPHLALLRRIAQVMDWMSSRASIDLEVLQIAARDRLVGAGLLRSELACARAEYEALHKRFTQPLVEAGFPHFEGLSKASWVRQTLVDRRQPHPLRWACLLAMGDDTDPGSLDRALAQASTRVVQPGLFGADADRRRACAPAHVYAALTGTKTIAEAAADSNLRLNDLQRWLWRDPQLVAHRKATSFVVRHRAACLTLQGHVRAHPEDLRSQVIAACIWAVRWLETNDPAALEKLLPATVAMFDRQGRLDFGDPASPESNLARVGTGPTTHADPATSRRARN